MPLCLARTWIVPPRQHPLAQIEKLVVRLEFLECRRRCLRRTCRCPRYRGMRPPSRPERQKLHIGVKERREGPSSLSLAPIRRRRLSRRNSSTFSCDIAYSSRPTALRASALLGEVLAARRSSRRGRSTTHAPSARHLDATFLAATWTAPNARTPARPTSTNPSVARLRSRSKLLGNLAQALAHRPRWPR